jgi:hypothetical protein
MTLLEDLLTSGAPELIYNFFLPFIFIFALLFGALEVIHIFGKKINLILALIFTFSTMVTPVFGWFATILPVYGAIAVFGVFITLFVVGTLIYGWRRGEDIYLEGGGKFKKVEHLRKKRGELWEKMQREGREGRRRQLYEQIKNLDKEIEFIEMSR